MATNNPFYESKIQILEDAFPSIDRSVVEDLLLNTNNDLNQTFEMLLEMSNGVVQPVAAPMNNNPFNVNSAPNPALNPFLQENPQPLTVRQELAQWRRELQEQGKQRSANTRKNHVSTPNLSILAYTIERPPRTDQYVNGTGLTHSTSAPNVSRSFQSRSSTLPGQTGHRQALNTNPLSPPPLPIRRYRSSSVSDSTNPFLSSGSRSIPTSNYTATSHNEVHYESSHNPFEETELPPPAYSEIQRDTVINTMP
ncbi:hypothetical protein BD560DRAFT_422340 [Blakeslea trispora]|nr:hypothetical protein BD560DRAFT_422340 [Blakeslea trispora]